MVKGMGSDRVGWLVKVVEKVSVREQTERDFKY
jgi:hypothetical protein